MYNLTRVTSMYFLCNVVTFISLVNRHWKHWLKGVSSIEVDVQNYYDMRIKFRREHYSYDYVEGFPEYIIISQSFFFF